MQPKGEALDNDNKNMGKKYAKVRICDLQISTRKLGVLTKEVLKRYISVW